MSMSMQPTRTFDTMDLNLMVILTAKIAKKRKVYYCKTYQN